MKKLKKVVAFLMVCAMCFGTIVYAKDSKNATDESVGNFKTFYTYEERMEIERRCSEILKEVGVGSAENYNHSPLQNKSPRAQVYVEHIKTNIGGIYVTEYRPDGSWEVKTGWHEGMLGTGGQPLFCVDMMQTFQAGYKTPVDASTIFNKQTIQMIAAMLYYYDHYFNVCDGIDTNYDYLFKQCAVWWILRDVYNWYPGLAIETGYGVFDAYGHSYWEHLVTYQVDGMEWAKVNYQYFYDAWGTVYTGAGQPVANFGGTYTPHGWLEVWKKSADPPLTDGNNCYSLEGAEYTAYGDESLTNAVGKMITEKQIINYSTYYISNRLQLDPGTYYVKETKAPPGYALDPATYPITITTGKVSYVGNSEGWAIENPQMNPVDILLGKIDAETNQNKPQGSGKLEGAQFTVKYYAGKWDKNVDPITLGKTPIRTWVFETNAEGFCYFREEDLVSGDEFWLDGTGAPALPLGTVTIQETKAPEGYHINNEVYVVQITSEGDADMVHTYNKPIVPENILKLDLVKKQEGTDIVIPDAVFEHTKPDGTKETVKTDMNGELSLKGLQHGLHQIQEISVMDGYVVNQNVLKFTVSENNEITLQSTFDTSLGKIEFQISEEGNIVVNVEDRLAPFCLLVHKINNEDLKLQGAEFTLYSDKMCSEAVKKGITDENGILKFTELQVGKKYYLQETKAPEGYRIPTDLLGNPIVYEVYTESVPIENKFELYINGKLYGSNEEELFFQSGTKANREVNTIIVNKVGFKLPNTGSIWMVPILLSGSILCAATCSCSKKRKYGKGEK